MEDTQPTGPADFEPRYNPQEVEEKIYQQWEASGFFNPDICIEKGITTAAAEPFSIVLPPPNVTGTLHMGHAAMLVIEDIMVRHARMNGKKTVWIPGTDHAAIATQSKVEKEILKTEKKSRHDLGREEFLRRVHEFAQQSHDTIVHQVKRMGASLDWSREAYTLDEKRELAVRTAFKKMYDMGLIDRRNRVVNWDPKGQTTISDVEIVYEERKAKLYTFKYSADFPIAISTTRPETKFGDTAVAVHPDDERYKPLVGKEYDVTFCGEPLHIKIIADQSVEKDFGTGALGVTPAHSMIDWEIAERHNLPLKQVIDEYGKMMVGGETIAGKKTAEAREAVVELLRTAGLIEKEEEISQNIATAERTGGIIEPLPKLQWFILINKKFGEHEKTLKELMREAVANGNTKILPEHFEKIYFSWIDNLRDWCISRQIWFGHQIPVWYHSSPRRELKDSPPLPRGGGEHSDANRKGLSGNSQPEGLSSEKIYVGIEAPEHEGWQQDPDTLDTWFSSGLWPFSTLGWPHSAETASRGKPGPENDFANYFPNSVLETGYDILFFWVARMILMSTCLMGEIPFQKVYLHGLVRDDKGRKMSKSLGNIIDPLTMADKYGADATRLSLVIGAAAGNDLKLSEDRVRGYRNFSTKIWNIGRFIRMNQIGDRPSLIANREDQGPALAAAKAGPWIEEFAALKSEVSAHIENFEFHLAAEKTYHYVWHRLADEIIEAEKEVLKNGTDDEKAASYAILEEIFLDSLKLLHPFMPFVTEEIWQKFRPGTMLMVEKWQR